MSNTKWELLKTAINMFAERGYANVSVRDIAAAMNINQASIYNHFAGKEDLLTEAFILYTDSYTAKVPPLRELVDMLGTVPTEKIWKKIQPVYAFSSELYDLMPKIMSIAITERRNNVAAKTLFATVFVTMPRKYVGGLLKEMVKRGMIEPLDIKSFVNAYSSFDLFSSLRMGGDFEVSTREWRQGHKYLFSLLKFKK